MGIILIDETNPSALELVGAPGANREHFIRGGALTIDSGGKLQVGALGLYQGVEFNPESPVPMGKGQPINLTYAGNVGGYLDILTR